MRFIFVGDVMLGRLVNEHLTTAPPEYPWGDTFPLLKGADALFINLECVIADRGRPWREKVFTFRTDAGNVAVLTAAHVTAASLANNHSLDYGAEALEDCLAILRRHGIWPAGAGVSAEAARQPAVFSVGDIRVAEVAFTDDRPDWEAGTETPGIWYVPLETGDPRFAHLLSRIDEAKKKSDCVIVSAHWGPNWGYSPLEDHVKAAHLFIDQGADIVFGHSPHVMRGIEIYRTKPILYSCGDYVDDYAVDEFEPNDESSIFCLDGEPGRVQRIVLIPTIIKVFQARQARGGRRTQILRKMEALCAGLGTETREVPEGLEILPHLTKRAEESAESYLHHMRNHKTLGLYPRPPPPPQPRVYAA
jgi:poly-gamma-glutamate synthesis protein (capsule biosynthesis protein)